MPKVGVQTAIKGSKRLLIKISCISIKRKEKNQKDKGF